MKQPASILIVTLMLFGAGHVCRAQQEPAHRGTHLYQPPGVRVHDPWLVNVDGTVHLFHLPDAWHATSRDCVFWEPHRAILANSAFTAAERNYNTEPDVWTGCAVRHEGKIYLFWTGNKGVNRRLCNRTCLSISSDGGKTFTHHPDNPVIKPDPRWYDTENDPAPEYPYHGKTHRWSGGVDGNMALMDWRDIAIVRDSKTGLFHGYIVARLRGKKNDKESACIARVSSKDLVHWEVHPPAFHPGTWGLHEVPDVFQLGGKWYLTAMATNPREGVYHGDDPLLRWGHLVGESDTPEGPFRLVKDNCVMAGVDQAKGYYSMRTVEFKGERLAFACGDKLSLAVKLVPREGGGLQDVWWPANEKLFGEKRGFALRDAPGQPTIEAPPRDADSFMITAGLELGTASAAGITFRKADGAQPHTLFLDSTKGCFEWVAGDIPGRGRIAARTWPIKPGGKHTIRVINIEQHVVVYLDDQYVMNGRGQKLQTAGLALTSVGGKARLRDIQYWGPKNGMPNLPPVDVRAARAGFRPALARLRLDRSQVTPGGTVQAAYTFRSSGASQSEMTVFVHVVRPDGRHIGADFEPDLPTSRWPQDGFVREGPFPIVVPEDAAPGRYQVWIGMFPPGGGDRIPFENAERQRGSREYHVGEFDVVAAGFTMAPKPAVFNWLAVDETKIVQSPAMATPARSNLLQRLTLSVDQKVLNPVRDPAASAKLILTGIHRDGSQRVLEPSAAVIQAKTKSASGNVDVVAIEGDKVLAKEGGIATVEASVVEGGKTFKAATEVVVAPFFRDYHQTLVLKLFLGMEGQPVERLAKEPLFQKPHDVICTFEEALEVIRKADNLTRGMPKIIYLVGWQKGGHDHGYPAWSEVNPRLKRKQDATALESLRWLIREARQFHTTVSLHINMVDAYKQSPLWDEYVAKDCFAKDPRGQIRVGGIQMKGEDMYNVVYPKEWEAGLAQRRIDGLIQMIPELKDGHTIHIDVFVAQGEGGKPLSAWHAKPENGGLTPAKYVETQRKIFHYWRDRGFDVTGEGIFWAHPPGEGFTGLQAMSWWYPSDHGYQMQIPECLMARGRTDRGGDGDFRFGSSMHGEEIWNNDKTNMPGFLGMFCRTTLPWYYLSRLERQRFEHGALYYSDGVVARVEGGKRIIRKGEFVLREDDHLFVPALWNKQEIIAYSKQGYGNRSWQLPDDWRGVRSVDLYRITLEGCVPMKKSVLAADGKLALSLGKDEAVSIVPAGTDISAK